MSETSEKNNQWTFEYVVKLWQEGGFESIAELHNKTLKGGDASCAESPKVSTRNTNDNENLKKTSASNPQPKGSNPKAAVRNGAINKCAPCGDLNEIAEKAHDKLFRMLCIKPHPNKPCLPIITRALSEAYELGRNERDSTVK